MLLLFYNVERPINKYKSTNQPARVVLYFGMKGKNVNTPRLLFILCQGGEGPGVKPLCPSVF